MVEANVKDSLSFEVFTLFPEVIENFVGAGLMGKAVKNGHISLYCTNYRDHSQDKHTRVDDIPFGGGGSMLISVEPVVAALEAVEAARGPMHRILLTPSAPRFDQRAAERLARDHARIGLFCGRYEGIDDRVREAYIDECFSLGDFVLNGGEVAALAMIEAIARLREGVLGNPNSAHEESFAKTEGEALLLEHPHYTRPALFRKQAVPEPLLSGDHAKIARWRRWQACLRTWELRADLRVLRDYTHFKACYLAVDSWPIELEHQDVEQRGKPRRWQELPVWVAGDDFKDLKSLRKTIRKRHQKSPWMVYLNQFSEAAAAGERSLEVVLDCLATVEQVQEAPPLILLLSWRDPRDLSYAFQNVEKICDAQVSLAIEVRNRLAKEPRMNDVSQSQSESVLEVVKTQLQKLDKHLHRGYFAESGNSLL